MTTCTPLGLVFPEGSDRACDVAPTTCEFAAGVEGYLNQLDALVQRTATTLPMAWVRTREPVPLVISFASLSGIQPVFDTVVADTDNMVDLTVRPSEILINRTGIYLIGFYVRGQVTLLAPGNAMNTFSLVSPTGSNSFPITGTGFNSYLPKFRSYVFTNGYIVAQTNFVIVPLSAGETYTLTVNPSGNDNDTFTLVEADLYAVWLGDVS